MCDFALEFCSCMYVCTHIHTRVMYIFVGDDDVLDHVPEGKWMVVSDFLDGGGN